MNRSPVDQPERVAAKQISRDDLEAILDSLVEGIVTLNAQRQVIGLNRAACEILEIDRQEALHSDCRGLFGQHFCAQATKIREAVESGRAIDNLLAQLQTASGRQKTLNFRTNVLRNGQSEPRGSVVVFRDVTELMHLKEDLARRYRLHNIVGKSKVMQEIFRLIEEVADSDATVLIEGESGTGKELVARAIHHQSPRRDGPFVAVNCSALAEGVLESELFGHVEGAFTGAMRDKRGRFEAATDGTIFLDEIGDVAAGIQVKLLRVLQERIIERVGSEESIHVDLRVIAATNRPLVDLVAEGRFRQDLFYRLRVVPIQLPPLRERRDDIPLLAQHFVDKFREETGRPIEEIGPEALTLMLDYPWPGNVRELENAVEYAFVKSRGGQILPAHLPPELNRAEPMVALPEDLACPIAPPAEPEDDARELLRRTLDATGWNVARAARRLDISRTTIYERIRRYQLQRPEDKI